MNNKSPSDNSPISLLSNTSDGDTADSFIYHRYNNLPLPPSSPLSPPDTHEPTDIITLSAFPPFNYPTAKNSITITILRTIQSLLLTLFDSSSLPSFRLKLSIPNDEGINLLDGKEGIVFHFSKMESERLKRMLDCRYLTGRSQYCGCCPKCLSKQSKQKVFINLDAERRRLGRELDMLKKLKRYPQVFLKRVRDDWEKAGSRRNNKRAVGLGRRLEWLKSCLGIEDEEILAREEELKRINEKKRLECKGKTKLIQGWHYFISLSFPSKLRGLFDVDDRWFQDISLSFDGRRTGKDIQAALGLMEGKVMDCGAKEFFRDLLRRLLAQELEEMFPDIELPYVQQVHPHGLFDEAPDIHFLLSRWGVGKDGQARKVLLDENAFRLAVLKAYRILGQVAVWGAKRWTDGCRLKAFKDWRMELDAALVELEGGLPEKCVDVRMVQADDLLTVQRYMRRMPMERLRSLRYDLPKNEVIAGFWEKTGVKSVRLTVAQFLRRLAGSDGRQGSLRVMYGGLYALNNPERRREGFGQLDESRRDLMEGAVERMRVRNNEGWLKNNN